MSIPEWNAAQSDFYATHDRTQEAWPEGEDEPVVEWTGSETAKIARHTNPWLQYGDKPIDLLSMQAIVRPRLVNHDDCDQCGNLLRGVIEAMDTDAGIQRCDQCQAYEGDLQAARALRDAWFPRATIWFHGTN